MLSEIDHSLIDGQNNRPPWSPVGFVLQVRPQMLLHLLNGTFNHSVLLVAVGCRCHVCTAGDLQELLNRLGCELPTTISTDLSYRSISREQLDQHINSFLSLQRLRRKQLNKSSETVESHNHVLEMT